MWCVSGWGVDGDVSGGQRIASGVRTLPLESLGSLAGG